MLKHLSFDGDRTTYLIQGQEFVLNFNFNKFWNKISFMSPIGTFKSITNVYHPEIKKK